MEKRGTEDEFHFGRSLIARNGVSVDRWDFFFFHKNFISILNQTECNYTLRVRGIERILSDESRNISMIFFFAFSAAIAL